MANLELQDVRKTFGNVEVIPNFNLEIKSGEFLVLVGPSGSGKSTLLRMIAGLEETTAGDIVIDGENITHVDPSARDFAMVFQSYALYPHMTVEQNISFALRMRKEDPAEIDRRVKEAIAMLNLTGLEKRKPGQLSGGQRQRVAMGRCVARKPKLFLFDEPLSNLDAKLRVQTRIEIRRLHERIQATSIFVTHDQVEAMTMADRIALLKDGYLQQVGTPQELYLKPSNSFVATFMGTPEMNLFDGEVVAQGDEIQLAGERPMSLPAGAEFRSAILAAASPGTKVKVGVRPEHLTILPQQARGSIELTVSVVEWLGHEIFVFGDFNGRQVIVRLPETNEAGKAAALPKAGDRLFVSPMADRWHVFDAGEGRNLLA